jgi:hypothetical protein
MAKNDCILSQHELKERLDYNKATGQFTWKVTRPGMASKGSNAGTKNREGYIQIMVKGKMHAAHRLAWLYIHGNWPDGIIDHINGIPNDNRIENLRTVSASENSQNQRKAKTGNISGFLGVTKHYKGWKAQICKMGIRHHLGTYKTPEEAYAVYLKAKRKFHESCTI